MVVSGLDLKIQIFGHKLDSWLYENAQIRDGIWRQRNEQVFFEMFLRKSIFAVFHKNRGNHLQFEA